jgi:hypothetical protein
MIERPYSFRVVIRDVAFYSYMRKDLGSPPLESPIPHPSPITRHPSPITHPSCPSFQSIGLITCQICQIGRKSRICRYMMLISEMGERKEGIDIEDIEV